VDQIQTFVENATRDEGIDVDDIHYWRSKLFSNFIAFLLSVCLIGLIPGVIVAFQYGYTFIGFYAVIAVLSTALVSLNDKINLQGRKYFVFAMSYSVGVILVIGLGQYGIGILYLLALSIFVTLTFSRFCAYCSVTFNFVLCVFCAFIIHYKLFNSPLLKEYDLNLWLAVSSNLIFLNLVCVLLINTTINILEQAIVKEKVIKVELGLSNHQLKESEAQYKTLFSQSPMPMWVLNRENLMFLQVNDAALQNYGYTREEFLSMTIQDIKLEEDMETFYENMQISNKPGTLIRDITKHRRKNNDVFYVEVSLNSIQLGGNLASLVIARDITEHIRHTNAIERQNKKLREISYIQSHFVRAPLARILGLVDLIGNTDQEPELLTYLDQSAKELDEIIRKITNHTIDF